MTSRCEVTALGWRPHAHVFEILDVSRGMHQFEPYAFAVMAGREPATLYHSNLMRVRVRRVVDDAVNPGLRHDLSRFEFLRHCRPLKNCRYPGNKR